MTITGANVFTGTIVCFLGKCCHCSCLCFFPGLLRGPIAGNEAICKPAASSGSTGEPSRQHDRSSARERTPSPPARRTRCETMGGQHRSYNKRGKNEGPRPPRPFLFAMCGKYICIYRLYIFAGVVVQASIMALRGKFACLSV